MRLSDRVTLYRNLLSILVFHAPRTRTIFSPRVRSYPNTGTLPFFTSWRDVLCVTMFYQPGASPVLAEERVERRRSIAN